MSRLLCKCKLQLFTLFWLLTWLDLLPLWFSIYDQLSATNKTMTWVLCFEFQLSFGDFYSFEKKNLRFQFCCWIFKEICLPKASKEFEFNLLKDESWSEDFFNVCRRFAQNYSWVDKFTCTIDKLDAFFYFCNIHRTRRSFETKLNLQ